jgi:hypothetical protein
MNTWRASVKAYRVTFQAGSDANWRDTEALKTEIAQFRQQVPEAGISRGLFDKIVAWKLRQQRSRTEILRTKITESVIGEVTATAFRLQHDDKFYLAQVRFSLLQALPGVGPGVASAILALTFPSLYAVIDQRVWRLIYGKRKDSFGWPDYEKYLREICDCATEMKSLPQEVDFLAWRMCEK